MANYIINQLLLNNQEFNIIYNALKSKGKIFTFDTFYNHLANYKFLRCEQVSSYVQPQLISLRDIYRDDLNLFSPYLVAVNTIKAIMDKQIGDEVITKKPTIVYGKQYLTKNFPNVYDCTSIWIETEKYIIDPVLAIVVDKSIKSKMFYHELHRRKDYVLDFNQSAFQFTLSGIYDFEAVKYGVYRKYNVPKRIIFFHKDHYQFTNKSCQMRDYLRTHNPNVYKKLMMLIKLGKIEDLSTKKYFDIYEKVKICPNSNPDLTFATILKKGLNYGRCGIFAKLYSNHFLMGKEHTYHNGVCRYIKGSKNSLDGNHAWIETKDKLIDTSLLMAIPIEFKKELGYKTFKREKLGTLDKENVVFNDNVDVAGLLLYHDVLFENEKNGSKFFKYDFSEDLPDIVKENGNDYYSEKYKEIAGEDYDKTYLSR